MRFTLTMFVLLMFAKGSLAQLSGTYTIGGTSPSYATPQLAVAALGLPAGISGPVIFNIRPGTYSGEIIMGNVVGSSSTNTITFQAENGDSTSVIITDSSSATQSNNFTMLINGTDYLTLKNLTIERSGTLDYSGVIYVGGGSRFFQLRNSIVQSAVLTTFNNSLDHIAVNIPIASDQDSLATISNNIITGGSYGINIQGQGLTHPIPLTQITNNRLLNQDAGGIQMTFVNGPTIRNNVITTLSTNTFTGIYVRRGTHNTSITLNKVTGQSNGICLQLDTVIGDAGTHALVANNFFHTMGNGGGITDGIAISSSTKLNIYYNTVNITSTNTSNAALYLSDATSDSLNVRNNIFANTGGGYAYFLVQGSLANLTTLDYNDLYATPVAFLDTGDIATLVDWQTASSKDAHSVSANPQFTSSTDLHSGSAAVNNLGVAIAGISTDIDGDSRSGSTPDIGADEFTPLNANLSLEGFVLPITGLCGDSATTFAIVLRNLGLNAQNNFVVHADITGTFTGNLSETISTSVSTNSVDTITFTQTLNTYTGGTITVTAYSSLSGDQYRANDTIHGSFDFGGHPNVPSVISPQIQCDNNVQASASPDSGDVIFWYDQPSGGNLLYVGNTFNPAVTTDTTFYVESHTGSGTTGCLRITEIEPNDGTPFFSDFIEIQNLSGVALNATGWKVAASLDNNDINAVNANLWDLGTFAPGEVQYRDDGGADPTHYWGSNLLFTGGFGSWVMIIDNNGNIVDFVSWDWDSTSIAGMQVNINGFNITPGPEWAGNGYVSCTTGDDNQRIGNDDHNDASDWACGVNSPGVQNANISGTFTHCGIGLCGSPRLPLDITLVPGVNPVNLGNDTVITGAFSLVLDAGPGYDTYIWSNGDTTQTTTVSTLGTFSVTVIGGPNSCTYTDSIDIDSPTGISNLIGVDEISMYPNPATDRLVLVGKENLLAPATIMIKDLSGRSVTVQKIKISEHEYAVDLSNLNGGVYFLQVVSGNRTGTQKFVVMK